MRRWGRIAGAAALLLALAVAGGLLLVRTEWAEARVEALAREAIGREVDVEDLSLLAHWPPALRAGRVSIANPGWAQTDHLVDAHDLRASFDAAALLSGRVVIGDLSIERAEAGLEREGERATWKFGEQGAEPSRFELRKASVGKGRIFYAEHGRDTGLDVRLEGGAGSEEATLTVQASGRFRGEEASANVSLPGLLFSMDQAIRADGTAQVGATQASFDGTFQAAAGGIGPVDARVSLAGESLAGLEALAPFELPATPPYTLEGALRHEAAAWHLTGFAARVGNSDLRGDFSYSTRGARGFVSADLASDTLDFDDLGRKAREARQDERIVPDAPFQTGGWGGVDAEVRLDAARIVDAPFGVLSEVEVRFVLEQGRVKLEPLAFDLGEGRVEARVVLDAREPMLFGSVNAELRGIDPGALFEALRRRGTSLGDLHGRIDLSGRGNSLRTLLGSSDGDIVLMMSEGSVSGLLVEALGLDLGEALLVLGTKGKDPVPLLCAVMDFDVQRGVARTDAFIVDTADTLVVVDGSIDLGREILDLTITPRPKDPSIGSARSPIEVTGTLKDPAIAPRAGPLAARGGAAALLGLVNPLLAVLPFIEAGGAEDANCKALLQAAQKEADAASVGASGPKR